MLAPMRIRVATIGGVTYRRRDNGALEPLSTAAALWGLLVAQLDFDESRRTIIETLREAAPHAPLAVLLLWPLALLYPTPVPYGLGQVWSLVLGALGLVFGVMAIVFSEPVFGLAAGIVAAALAGIAARIPAQEVTLGEAGGKLALVGWGSTYGPIHQAVRRARRGHTLRKPGEAVGDPRAHFRVRCRAGVRGQVDGPDALGQRDHTPGHRLPIENAGHRRAGIDQHHFSRSAADVEDHRRAFAGFEQDVAAEHGEPRFFFRRDDVEADAGFAVDALDEGLAVGCPAAGLGRDRAGKVDAALAQLVGTDLQRAKCPVHRRIGQPARLREAFSKPDDAAERIDYHEVIARRPRDQQAAIVRAQIDRGISLAMKGQRPLPRRPSRERGA